LGGQGEGAERGTQRFFDGCKTSFFEVRGRPRKWDAFEFAGERETPGTSTDKKGARLEKSKDPRKRGAGEKLPKVGAGINKAITKSLTAGSFLFSYLPKEKMP